MGEAVNSNSPDGKISDILLSDLSIYQEYVHKVKKLSRKLPSSNNYYNMMTSKKLSERQKTLKTKTILQWSFEWASCSKRWDQSALFELSTSSKPLKLKNFNFFEFLVFKIGKKFQRKLRCPISKAFLKYCCKLTKLFSGFTKTQFFKRHLIARLKTFFFCRNFNLTSYQLFKFRYRI